MVAQTPRALVSGAPRVPLSYGLFSAAAFRPGSDRERFESGGVTWETITCDPVDGLGQVDCDPAEIEGLPRDLSSVDQPIDEASSFTVYGHHTCSPVGTPREVAQAFALAHLTLREEARVEQALWTGDLGNVPNFSGANSYPAPTSLGTFEVSDVHPEAFARALGRLEQGFAEEHGSQGVLHVSREVATVLLQLNLLTQRGGRLFTGLDTQAVAGAGYDSDAMVMTPQLLAYRSQVYPSDPANHPLTIATNEYTVVAERTYLVGFDSCGLSSVTLTPAA